MTDSPTRTHARGPFGRFRRLAGIARVARLANVANLAADAWAGLVAGALGLGVAHLLAQFVSAQASPVIAVGGAAIDATPTQLKEFAIREFGTNDKRVLLTGIVAVLALLTMLVGLIAARRLAIGLALVGVLGVVAVVAELRRPAAHWYFPWPTVVGLVLAGSALFVLLRLRKRGTADRDAADRDASGSDVAKTPVAATPVAPERTVPVVAQGSRRAFLLASGAVAAGGAIAISLGNALAGSRSVSAARRALRLPAPANPATPLPAGINPPIDGLSPYITAVGDFYRVDTALVTPQVDPDTWTLTVNGMVARPFTLSLKDILGMPLIERDITMTCVSNEVGGPYVSTARWLGVPLKTLMDRAGIDPRAEQLYSTSSDGFTTSTPTLIALDGRDAMIAIGMNGEPLPLAHGFPARMLVPGLYGYVSGCKWITSITATTYAAKKAYWTQRKWDINGPIHTETRIDVPAGLSTVKSGVVAVAGVAWAQHRGIRRVEVSIDDGSWQPAQLAATVGDDTWRQWWYRWQAAPGSHRIRARATDGTGTVQTDHRQGTFPRGATGIQDLIVNVS